MPGAKIANPDSILVALYRRLDADATLQGATYLDGEDKIFLGPVPAETDEAGAAIAKPTLVLTLVVPGSSVPETGVTSAIAQAVIEVARLDNGAADVERFGRIAKRVADLLHEYDLNADASGLGLSFRQPVYVEGPPLGPLFDPAHRDLFYGNVRARLLFAATA